MKISYNWLKWYLPDLPSKLIQAGVPDAPEAKKLADIITYHLAEVESIEEKNGDSVFDIKILPNRAHDLLSHQGVAREIASLINIKYVDPTPKYKIPASAKATAGKPELKVEINTEKCRRDAARIVRNIKVGPSPDWVVAHLESIGQRSINNIVDATNIVMFDCGQPSHVFDMEKVKGPKLDIDTSDGEKISFLGGVQKDLQKGMVAIYDAEGNAIGTGVKGGTLAELDDNTKNIILQIDNFDPVSVRKMGQALNMFTEGRKRFENDLSPELIPYAMRELSALIMEMCPEAIFEDIVDVYPEKQKERKLSFSAERISSILGLKVSDKQIEDILKRYLFKYKKTPSPDGHSPLAGGEEYEITVPLMRLDLVTQEDMAEEVVRILGYDKVKGNIPQIDFKPKINETYAKITWARNKLLADGYSEVMTYTFCDKGEVEVMQSASDKKFLRTNLSDGLKESIKLNQLNAPFLGIEKVKVFEVGTVFKKSGEEMHVAYGDKKEIKEMKLDEFVSPPRLSGTPPQKGGEEFPPRLNKEGVGDGHFKMWSLFPFIARDIAVFVPENVKSGEISKIIKENMGEMVIKGPELFDEFKKPVRPDDSGRSGGYGQISYAFSLVFQSYERTLTDAETNEIMEKITERIKAKGWQMR